MFEIIQTDRWTDKLHELLERPLATKTHLVRRRVRKLGRGGQRGQTGGGVEAGDGGGGGVEAHGDSPAGLAEGEGEGGGLTELTDLKERKLIKREEMSSRI